MSVKQVFRVYESEEEDRGLWFSFCPRCSTRLAVRPIGGRQRPACSECGFVQFQNPVPGVVIVIEEDGQVLLGQRAGGFGRGKWGLPQGFIEFDEDFLTAAIREVQEETGLVVEIQAILNVVSNMLSPRLHTLAVVLQARVVHGEPRAGDDLKTLAWFPIAGPLPEMAFEADEFIIRRIQSAGQGERLPVDPDFAK
jgi:ADP-ribose pyrophosphatase YjhB (NUDIX family)